MNCKVCNTRLGAGERSCPNCGTDAPAKAAFERSSAPTRLPSAELSTAREESEDEVELELDDVTGEIPDDEKPEPPDAHPTSLARFARRPTPPAPAASRPAARAPAPPPPAQAPAGAPAPLFSPDAAGLRALLAERPEMLEEGLRVFCDERGAAVGAQYSTAVGEIDLLATDSRGDLVVVMISEKSQGEGLVGELLQRLGWVRKHLGEGRRQVRAIVLCDEPPHDLSYAAAAVSDTVRFKTYRVALAFEDLEV